MLKRNIDTVVLGCTHYPFVIAVIQDIVGDKVRVIDPAPAVARQVRRLLENRDLRHPADGKGRIQFFTSAANNSLSALLAQLLGEEGQVRSVHWENDQTLKEPLLSGG